MHRKRKWIQIRYIKKMRVKNPYKPAAGIIGWMKREKFDKERLLRESEEICAYIEKEKNDPYYFLLEEILQMREPPPAYVKGRFIKKEDRGISYSSYVFHRQAHELMLWFLITGNLPQQGRDYYRGRLRPETIKKRIKVGQTYWAEIKQDTHLMGPVKVLGWDGNVALWKTLHTKFGEFDIRIAVERFEL